MTDNTATVWAVDGPGIDGSPGVLGPTSARPAGESARPAVVEQAKGLLMVVYGLTADAAFDLLRQRSQTHNVKVRDIATELVGRVSEFEIGGTGRLRFDRLFDQLVRDLQHPAAGETRGTAQKPARDASLAPSVVHLAPDRARDPSAY